ncbi:MAG: MotE family protein [Parvularculaceae bacterium]
MRFESLMILGVVFACAFTGRAAVVAAETIDASDGNASTQSGPIPAICINGAFADELREQSKRLTEGLAARAEQDQERAVMLAHVKDKIAELEKINAKLSATLASASEVEGKAERKVVALYETMKPELAGSIIGEMDPEFAAGLLLGMNAESASGILSSLPAGRAYAITVLMAGST